MAIVSEFVIMSGHAGPSSPLLLGMNSSQPSPLRVQGLRKAYADVVAVDGLDLEIAPGECFGLLGPNGAGKTTTIEICEGLLQPDAGEVSVLGLRWDRNEQELRERLGVQLQETQLSEKLTVAETLRLFRSFFRTGVDVDTVIARVQLEEKRNSRVGKLSGGQKQRLALACSLVGDPDLLFLDEPTTGLDPQSRRQLWELIDEFKTSGKTTVLTTHYMDEAEMLCDRVAIVDHGKVIALGSPRQLIESLGAEHVVEFGLAEGQTGGVTIDMLTALPGVQGARSLADGYELSVGELHRAVPALLSVLAERKLELSKLTTHSATLEDVFVHLTGRQLREA
jgi:ABC-2 type transport system ATP-binding protein